MGSIKEKAFNVLQTLTTHDESLFCYGGAKLQSGRPCAHNFNETKKNELHKIEKKLGEITSQLETAKQKCLDVWKYNKKNTKAQKTKFRNNDLKAKLRKKQSVEKRCKKLFISLGGETGDYNPSSGAFQITMISQEDFKSVIHSRDVEVLKYLRQIGCFREQALDLVNDYLSEL